MTSVDAALRADSRFVNWFFFLLSLTLVTSALGCGFLGPPLKSQNQLPIVYDFKRFTLEERSIRITAAVSKDNIVIELRQVFFNVGKKPVEFAYYAPLPAKASISAQSLSLHEIKGENKLATAKSLALGQRFPYLLGCLNHKIVHTSPVSLPPHRPWVVRYTYSVPAELIGDERLFTIPLARRGPIGAPIRRVTISVRTIGGLSHRLECLSHRLKPPMPRKRWAYMSLRITDSIPEEDLVLNLPKLKQNALSPLAFTDVDGTWIRARMHLPNVTKKKINAASPLAALFAVDVSGSLYGSPLQTIKDSVKQCISQMGKEDLFNIVPFALIPRSLHHEFLKVNKETLIEANTYLKSLKGLGGTNLGETLQQAAELITAAPQGKSKRLFLTIDGKADVGIIDPARLVTLFHQLMPKDMRMDTVVLGCNVDARLLASMIGQRSGRLRFAENAKEAKELLTGLFATTRPRYKRVSIGTHTGGLPLAYRSNSNSATFSEIPLVIGTRLPKERPPAAEISVTAHSAEGSLTAASQTKYTTAVNSSSEAVGEAVRSMFLVPTIAAIVEGVERMDRLPKLPRWQEARVRRILRLPSGKKYRERMAEIARSSGPEVRLRHRLLRQLKESGTFLPRPYLSYVFRRVGRRVFFRQRGGKWVEEPDRKSTEQAINYGSPKWTTLLETRPDLRPVLALGTDVRFFDKGKTYQINRAK